MLRVFVGALRPAWSLITSSPETGALAIARRLLIRIARWGHEVAAQIGQRPGQRDHRDHGAGDGDAQQPGGAQQWTGAGAPEQVEGRSRVGRDKRSALRRMDPRTTTLCRAFNAAQFHCAVRPYTSCQPSAAASAAGAQSTVVATTASKIPDHPSSVPAQPRAWRRRRRYSEVQGVGDCSPAALPSTRGSAPPSNPCGVTWIAWVLLHNSASTTFQPN